LLFAIAAAPEESQNNCNLHGTREFYQLTGALPECSKASLEVVAGVDISASREMGENRQC
jgi:hypothetical protein